MSPIVRFSVSIPLASLALFALAAPAWAAERVDFARDVRPILTDKCFRCHGPDEEERQAELRLDLESSAKADRDGERVVFAGKPGQSKLVARITSDDDFLRMPPADSGKSLSPDEIDLLTRWIAEGADWAQHWAYVPPRDHPTPEVENSQWPVHWIDRFLLARLEKEGLRPSPDADAVTLIRRLYFDLLGLPPAADEASKWAERLTAKASSGIDHAALEALVDELLQSPHFGERMAVYWLDLVRYADTVGYHGDQDHNISPYRDWVIDAFNDNMPFDQFTREQLAGDLLPDATLDQQIATGYNRLLQTSHEGGVQPKEYLAMYAADRVRNVSAVWMGATLGCAQCHDHKYDPYTMKDFYSMQAVFADIDEAGHFKSGGDTVPTRRPPEIKVLTKRERQRIADLEAQIAQKTTELESLSEKQQAAGEIVKQIKALAAERDAVERSARMTMITVSIEPRTIRLLPRGNWLDESGPVMQPAAPEFLGKLNTAGERPTRLDLANWLVAADRGAGGLTARVQVNRLWYLLFGVGLAKDLDDFGGQGEPTVHPELLDRLALEFINSGWDVKHMIKQIVTSRAYRQSSHASPELVQRDPENRLYARQSRFRLPAEMIRDAALSISGLLVRDVGGGPVKPYQPAGYYRHLNFPKRTYQHHTDARQWRRGVYVHWQRQFLHPMLKAFDAPRREECTAQRPRSNTPLAALVLLNDPTFVEAARALAALALNQDFRDDAARIDGMFRRAVSRNTDKYEQRVLLELLAAERKRYAADNDAAKSLVATGLSAAPSDIEPAELAAWTTVARAVLNLSEAITRN